jgi:CPA2 family monovalent cation:H+ antiporter-2
VHLAPLIIDLAIILGVAGIMTLIFQKIKQPVVLGYILAGVIVGPYTPPFQLVKDVPSIQTWAELGVIFLMFTLGLEFSFRKLLSVGVTAGLAAGLEVVFFLVAGYGVGQWFGWSQMDSVFLGAMLSISSTTIIIKALDELKLKSHRFSSLIFGILIVEDLFAILLLVGLTSIASTQSFSIFSLLSTGLNLILIVGSWFITGYFIVPRLMTYIGKRGTNEMVTLVSIGLCLTLVVIAAHFGYSAALGAFIMGSILAETKIIHRIEGLMAPLKDLFGAIFFVSIGMLIDPHIIWEHKETIIFLCIFTIVGKIFITSLGAIISGQSFKNSMQVGFGLAQIGEFSFIIASLGMALKAISPKLYPIGVAVSLVTTFTTPYFIKYSGKWAEKLENLLPWRMRQALDRYVIWCEHKKTGTGRNKEMLILIARWVANGMVVTLIFNLAHKFLGSWHQVFTWLLAFTVSSPFIWGMVFTSRKNYLRIRKEGSFSKAIIVMSFPILTAIWISILSTKYFPLKYVLPITGTFLILIYFTLFKRLESYYRWFEKTFLETFETPEKKEDSNQVFAKLAPWDSHLINIVVHPNATLVNRTLMESQLRGRFGINIVAIQRGMESIIAPKPSEVILPGDTLIMLGTDVQLDQARPELEIPLNIATMFPSNANYRLRHLRITPSSHMVNLSIRESGIRETYHAMIVGIERDSTRIINPDTDMQLLANDIIWVVGEVNMLSALFKDVD